MTIEREGRTPLRGGALAERLMGHVEFDTNGGCWLWSGNTHWAGYGEIYLREQPHMKAHRASYETFVGPIGDQWVLHKCDIRACVNPDHLYLGDALDNSADMRVRGRQARGERMGSARLTTDLVREIRASSESSRQLSARLPVSDSMIRRVRRGHAWSHVQ